jgi:hypothetical protein
MKAAAMASENRNGGGENSQWRQWLESWHQ